mmetsp:Transcript_10672/g.31820  ORF Transcript_10672/g.31820 Transcript_10672/m.31820 type:complete len:460 (+) Transcript_10672:95-1474(+)
MLTRKVTPDTVPEVVTPLKEISSLCTTQRKLVRGVSSFDVLAGFGNIFESSDGDGDTYALSGPVRRVDGFVSHSWRDNRFYTWLALCYHLHLRVALLAGLAAAAVVFYFEDGGGNKYLLPPVDIFVSVDGNTYTYSPNSVFAGTLAFLLALAYGFGCRQLLFVDKCCIDQRTPGARAVGLGSLAHILCRSHTFLLIYENDYFERLWCVYELAVFASTHGAGEGRVVGLEMLPVERGAAAVLQVLLMNLLLLVVVYQLPRAALAWGGGLQVLCFSAALAAPCVALLRSIEQKRKIVADLRAFRVADAKAADPRDRAYLEGQIAARWRGGLEGFEADVRGGCLFAAINAELGARDGFFRYVDRVVCVFGVLLLGFSYHANNPHETSHAITTLVDTFCAWPAAMWLHARLVASAARVPMPYGVRLPLATVLYVALITTASQGTFFLCRAPCRALVGYGCLRD